VQAVAGWSEYNDTQVEHRQPEIGWIDYLRSADFWEATLQNWQSEFLAVGSIAVFSIYLRQRGSSQSKPVGAGHGETGHRRVSSTQLRSPPTIRRRYVERGA